MEPHGKELSQDLKNRVVSLHKDGLGYKKIGNRQNLSPNTVARIIQRFSKTRQGRSKKLNPRARRQVQKLASQNRRRSAAGIAAEIADMGGQSVSTQTICRTLNEIGLHGRRPRRKPLLKLARKKARKQFTQDMQSKTMDYWNHILWSDETKINLFGSDDVQHVWRRPGEQWCSQPDYLVPLCKHKNICIAELNRRAGYATAGEEYQDNRVLPTVKHGGGLGVYECCRYWRDAAH